jgi:hypothetical protein
MTEPESGVERTRISRRKAIKLGAIGVAGGAAAWLMPGVAGGAIGPIGVCPRGSGETCGKQARQCARSRANGLLCVCASDSQSPGTHCVEDDFFGKCTARTDCSPGQVCVKRCVEIEPGFGFTMSVCAWPCHNGPTDD